MTVHFFVNNKPIQLETAPDRRLLDILREDLLLTGLAIQLEGCHITTIEGLAASGELDALQKAFIDEIAIQCGFCTPGMILSAKALLMKNPHPSRDEICRALAGNLCRCSGYQQIIRAINKVAEEGLYEKL